MRLLFTPLFLVVFAAAGAVFAGPVANDASRLAQPTLMSETRPADRAVISAVQALPAPVMLVALTFGR